jgi:hypothetical protein
VKLLYSESVTKSTKKSKWTQGDPNEMASECGQWPQEQREKKRIADALRNAGINVEPSHDCIGAFTRDFESGPQPSLGVRP